MPLIEKQDTVMREAISPRNRLCIILRYLTTGNSFQNLAYSVRIAPNTLSKLIPETLKAIIEVLGNKVITIVHQFQWRNLTVEKKIFNYRLSRACRMSENGFGIMVNIFHILLNVISLSQWKKLN
ncbi:hypothetical protein ALC60_00395 [Trachymyrmex zeteki]|uniref:Transposase Helix-turn-helix domain-containing protein n=1 Tax=Mycetomoellerius zeteki TaxID=64791 RepID=A0A151XJH4_9HYME|nr:hypothetical protein ALC60_00395 [Trachymyrmex zeteki]